MSMKGYCRTITLATAAMLAVVTPVRARAADNPAVLFMSDFESGVLNDARNTRPSQGWGSVQSMPTITTERARSGRYAMKAYLHKYTSPVPYKQMAVAMWRSTSDPRYSTNQNVRFFQDTWIGFSVYLPSSGPGNWSTASRTYEILAQWHDAHFSPIPSWDTEYSKNPVFSLRVTESNKPLPRAWNIVYLGDSRTPYPAIGTPRPFLYESFKSVDLGSIQGDLDKWTDWVIRIRWNFWRVGSTNNTLFRDTGSPNAVDYWKPIWDIPGIRDNVAGSATAGLIQVWKNGVLVHSASPVQIGTNDNAGPQFSVGLYKGWQSASDRDRDPVTDRVVYFDEFRYAGHGASYADVAPFSQQVKIPKAPTQITIK